MKMRRALILIAVIGGVVGQQGFVFEGQARRRHKPSQSVQYDSAGEGVTNRPGINPGTIDNIFQIPIAILQGTSSAAQSWRPENGDTINKVFDIPVQTLQAVGSLIKDRVQQQSSNSNAAIRDELKFQRRQQQLEEHNRLRDLQRIKRQQQHEEAQARRHHSFYDPLAWTNALADVLVGHGGLFSGHGGYGHRNFLGGHNDIFSGHKKKKKKKKKKPHYGGNGGHFGNHGSHFGNHGGNGGHLSDSGHKPIVQQILGGNGHIYQVHENLDDIPPPADLFPWNRRPRIQNKIAPRFDGEGRSA